MKRKIREKQFHLSDLFLLPICLIFLYPFYYMVINTFKTMADMSMNPTGLPKEVYLQNYVDILTNPQIYQSFGNTLFITVCSVLAIVVIGEMAAYPIAFRKSKLNDAFMVYLMIGAETALFPQKINGKYKKNGSIAVFDGFQKKKINFIRRRFFAHCLSPCSPCLSVPARAITPSRSRGAPSSSFGSAGTYTRLP